MQEFVRLIDVGLKAYGLEGDPQAFLALFLLLFARFGAFVFAVPFLGGRFVPNTVKIGVASGLVLLSFPLITPELEGQFGSDDGRFH